MKVDGSIVVKGLNFCHDHVSFLHHVAHVELILLIFLPLLVHVGSTEVQVPKSSGSDVYLPSFVCDFNNSTDNYVSHLWSVFVVEWVDYDEFVGDLNPPHEGCMDASTCFIRSMTTTYPIIYFMKPYSAVMRSPGSTSVIDSSSIMYCPKSIFSIILSLLIFSH